MSRGCQNVSQFLWRCKTCRKQFSQSIIRLRLSVTVVTNLQSVLLRKKSELKFVLSATHSIQVIRRTLTMLAVVLKSSTRSTAESNFHKSRPMVCHRSFFVPILIFKIASYTPFRISGIVNVDKLKIFDFILKMDLYTMENKVLKNCA